MRITILGNCGSGKSTLARKISQKFNIPHIQLDRFWFEANGHKLQKGDSEAMEKMRAYILEKAAEATSQESWVSDGWYARVQPLIAGRADKIVFLDIPLWRRLINHWHRIFFAERHQELNRWDDIKFTFEIVGRTFIKGPKMRKFLLGYPEKVVILRSYAEVEKFFQGLN